MDSCTQSGRYLSWHARQHSGRQHPAASACSVVQRSWRPTTPRLPVTRPATRKPHVLYHRLPSNLKASLATQHMLRLCIRPCRQFLSVYLPILVDEADFAADFLQIYRYEDPALSAPSTGAGTGAAQVGTDKPALGLEPCRDMLLLAHSSRHMSMDFEAALVAHCWRPHG